MQNVKNRFERLEKLQSSVSFKLDQIENKFIKREASLLDEINEDQYKFQCDLEEMLKDKYDEKKDVDKNYLILYDNITKLKTGQGMEESKFNKNQTLNSKGKIMSSSSIPISNKINKISENSQISSLKKNENNNKNSLNQVSKKTLLDKEIMANKNVLPQNIENNSTYEHPFSTFRNSQDENEIKVIVSNQVLLDNQSKYQLHKKQNYFLTNELVNLRVKLNKIKNKNQLLQNILKNEEGVKNCKLLGKVITSFIEKLAVNWNEIVDLIVDELIEEEIYNLNEIELERTNKLNLIDVKEITPINDIKKNLSVTENDRHNFSSMSNKESLDEINRILSEYRNQEEEIYKRYLK
jgi:hypothetical protein